MSKKSFRPRDLPPAVTFAARFLPKETLGDAVALAEFYHDIQSKIRRAYELGGHALEEEVRRLLDDVGALSNEDRTAEGDLLRLQMLTRNYGIPRKHLIAVIDGWNTVMVRQRYRDWMQAEAVLEQIAGAPARCLAALLRPDDRQRGEAAAQALGMAIGLSVSLQRLPWGLDHGRLFVAEDEMKRFGVRVEDLAEGRMTAQYQDLMWFQIKRGLEFVDRAEKGLSHFPDDGTRAFLRMLCAWQRRFFEELKDANYDVFDGDLEMGWWDSLKLYLATRRSPALAD